MDRSVQHCLSRIQNTTLSLHDFLKIITEFIIAHKDRLPDGTPELLSKAFSKERLLPKERITNARNRISQTREIDVVPSARLLSLIRKLHAFPSEFWTLKQIDSNCDPTNLLRHLYQRNRQNDDMNVVYRAFETTVTYLLVRRICRDFGVTSLTTQVRQYCSRLIMDQNNATDEEARKRVEDNLREDNRVGKIWYTYAAHLGGYGAFFLIGVAPTSLYEMTLKGSDDLESVASHFKSINIPRLATQHHLHELGIKIVCSVLPEAGEPILPGLEINGPTENPTRKRKRPKTKTTADRGSFARQTEDVLSSNDDRILSKRARLDRILASHTQTPTPMIISSHDGQGVLRDEVNGEFQHVEASSQSTLADSSLENQGLHDGYDPQQGLHPLFDGTSSNISVDNSVPQHTLQVMDDITYPLPSGYNPQYGLRPVYNGTPGGIIHDGYDPQQGLHPLNDGTSIDISVDGRVPQHSLQTMDDITYTTPDGYNPQYGLRPVYNGTPTSVLHGGYDPQQDLYPLCDTTSSDNSVDSSVPQHSLQTMDDITYPLPNGYDPQHGLRPVLPDEFSSMRHMLVEDTNMPIPVLERGSSPDMLRSQNHLRAHYQTQAVGFSGGYNFRGNTDAFCQADF